MKYLPILFIGLLFVTSCTLEQKSETEEEIKPEPSQSELTESSESLMAKLIDVSELDLHLDGENKWEISKESFTHLMKIKQQIYVISGNMENYTVESYNEMGIEFLGFVETIPSIENKKANVEFQKIITATNNQCLFLLESDLQQAQIAVINMSIIYDEVPSYFSHK